ncbi:MAG: hypothetical protein DELT_03324 [Desulfovibrio sp.]
MWAMTKRNLKLFFRDRGAVFFSLLSVLIIIALYAVFLGDTITGGMKDVKGVDFLMNSWVIAGILAVISMTSTLGALGIMVEDRAGKIMKDFTVSPLKRGSLAGSYIFCAFAVGVIMSLVALVVGEIFIVASGGEVLSAENMLKVVGGIFLSVLSSSSIVLFLVSFFKSRNAFTTASTVIGTLIGFLIGVYIPIGSLPEAVQGVIKVFPVSYSASFFRTVMTQQPAAVSFDGAPAGMLKEFNTELGVQFEFDGKMTTLAVCVIVMVVTAAVFYALSIWNLSRKKK